MTQQKDKLYTIKFNHNELERIWYVFGEELAAHKENVKNGQNLELINNYKLPKIKLKPLSFRRALENLFSNARRHATICQISTILVDETITINIDDDGPGIPENQRENALRPFHRLETSRNKETGGTGLGLAIATNIILSHGGTLELNDSPVSSFLINLSNCFE